MSQSEAGQGQGQTSQADDLLNASPTNAVELSEDALDRVAGGEAAAADVTINKQKAAHKAAAALTAFIQG